MKADWKRCDLRCCDMLELVCCYVHQIVAVVDSCDQCMHKTGHPVNRKSKASDKIICHWWAQTCSSFVSINVSILPFAGRLLYKFVKLTCTGENTLTGQMLPMSRSLCTPGHARKGKERKSIYIALFYQASQSAQTWITQFYLQITTCLPCLCKHSPDVRLT